MIQTHWLCKRAITMRLCCIAFHFSILTNTTAIRSTCVVQIHASICRGGHAAAVTIHGQLPVIFHPICNLLEDILAGEVNGTADIGALIACAHVIINHIVIHVAHPRRWLWKVLELPQTLGCINQQQCVEIT